MKSVGTEVGPGVVEVEVGKRVGLMVGDRVVGWFVGWFVGLIVELRVGRFVGRCVGFCVGRFVGLRVGRFVGLRVGSSVGFLVGSGVGRLVGSDVGRLVGTGVELMVGRGDGSGVLTSQVHPHPQTSAAQLSVRFSMLQNATGISPSTRVLLNVNSLRLVRFASSAGIVPVIGFRSIHNRSRPPRARLPSSTDTDDASSLSISHAELSKLSATSSILLISPKTGGKPLINPSSLGIRPVSCRDIRRSWIAKFRDDLCSSKACKV